MQGTCGGRARRRPSRRGAPPPDAGEARRAARGRGAVGPARHDLHGPPTPAGGGGGAPASSSARSRAPGPGGGPRPYGREARLGGGAGGGEGASASSPGERARAAMHGRACITVSPAPPRRSRPPPPPPPPRGCEGMPKSPGAGAAAALDHARRAASRGSSASPRRRPRRGGAAELRADGAGDASIGASASGRLRGGGGRLGAGNGARAGGGRFRRGPPAARARAAVRLRGRAAELFGQPDHLVARPRLPGRADLKVRHQSTRRGRRLSSGIPFADFYRSKAARHVPISDVCAICVLKGGRIEIDGPCWFVYAAPRQDRPFASLARVSSRVWQ